MPYYDYALDMVLDAELPIGAFTPPTDDVSKGTEGKGTGRDVTLPADVSTH